MFNNFVNTCRYLRIIPCIRSSLPNCVLVKIVISDKQTQFEYYTLICIRNQLSFFVLSVYGSVTCLHVGQVYERLSHYPRLLFSLTFCSILFVRFACLRIIGRCISKLYRIEISRRKGNDAANKMVV